MKKLLLLGAILTVANGAFAYDIIHPFYTPDKGVMTSDTTFSFEHQKDDQKGLSAISITKRVEEMVSYGITKDFTAYGGVEKNWQRNSISQDDDGGRIKDRTNSWRLGGSYNLINDGKHFLQAQGMYSQYKGKKSQIAKLYSFAAGYGYNFDCITPYITLNYQNTLNYGPLNDDVWQGKIGAYKKLNDNLGSTLAVAYLKSTGDEAEKEWDIEASLRYMFNPKTALHLTGTYALDDDVKIAEKTNNFNKYRVIASLKVAF